MTKLSPAAQAVKNAVLALYADENVHQFGWQLDAPTVAAALRAAADQVVPANGSRKNNEIRAELLAIADELEAQ
jgi:hypothetical protein